MRGGRAADARIRMPLGFAWYHLIIMNLSSFKRERRRKCFTFILIILPLLPSLWWLWCGHMSYTVYAASSTADWCGLFSASAYLPVIFYRRSFDFMRAESTDVWTVIEEDVNLNIAWIWVMNEAWGAMFERRARHIRTLWCIATDGNLCLL